MGEINEQCPSYDDGECVTYPAPYSVKCKDVKCRWQNIEEFNRVKDELFKKENKTMEKEEVINGVNVSGCKYYNAKNKCKIPHYEKNIKYTACKCDEWDCEYKQLKRAEAQYNAVVEQNKCLQAELQPFRQPYFKGLTTAVIAELAKSQIKTTAHNINAEALIDYIDKTTVNAGTENAIRIIQQAIAKYKGKSS